MQIENEGRNNCKIDSNFQYSEIEEMHTILEMLTKLIFLDFNTSEFY